MEEKEMVTIINCKFPTGAVPQNIDRDIRNTYTNVIYKFNAENLIEIKVSKREHEIVSHFKMEISKLLAEIKNENGALADKLSRQIRI